MISRKFALATTLLVAAAPAPGITVGLVVGDMLGKQVNGWLYMQGSMYTRSETKDYVTTQTTECCLALFQKGNSYIAARTEPLARNASGGVIKEKVVAIKRLDARPGEVLVPCGVLDVPTPLTLQNPKTGYSRSIVAVDGNLSLLEWRDPAGPCSEGD